MIRMMKVQVFDSWQEFIDFLRTYELKESLEKIDFHQSHGQVVARFITGEPDATKRAGYFARGEA